MVLNLSVLNALARAASFLVLYFRGLPRAIRVTWFRELDHAAPAENFLRDEDADP